MLPKIDEWTQRSGTSFGKEPVKRDLTNLSLGDHRSVQFTCRFDRKGHLFNMKLFCNEILNIDAMGSLHALQLP